MKSAKFKLNMALIAFALLAACSSSNNNKAKDTDVKGNKSSLSDKALMEYDDSKLPVVLVLNFHLTNRCPSCIAIEETTIATLKQKYSAEMADGRVKQYTFNVDEKANKAIADKYQAYGASVFITRSFQGKETTTELTGDGFKYARNKPEMFAEILSNKINEYLK